MAYFAPRFNVWCQVWRWHPELPNYKLHGYSLCQLRGPAPFPQYQVSTFFEDLQVEVLLPKYSDVETAALNLGGKADVIMLAGMGVRYLIVDSCSVKGAGFSNEYLLVQVHQMSPEEGRPYFRFPASEFHAWSVNKELSPPDGFTALPLITPAAAWGVLPPLPGP